MTQQQLSIAITGAGGAGVISVGELLLQTWAAGGGRGLLRKAFGPQIRGGESAALLKLTDTEHYTPADRYDLFLAFDWTNFNRFGDEITLCPGALVICGEEGELPPPVRAVDPDVHYLPLADLAVDTHEEGRVNMIALGLLGRLLGLASADLQSLARNKLAAKPQAYQDAAAACIEAGSQLSLPCQLAAPPLGEPGAWYLSGNQAAGLGALEAGVRFVAAYPITPASDVLEWMAGGLEKLGGQLVQAEDELAAINMTLGAAFGGVPSFTATSGPGLALMTESIGLAVASETPVTILDVMRGGPSTGIPTKSEQSDLNIALNGLHGDAPHLVLAPLDIADCVYTSAWAVHLAQGLQTAAIVLSDQFIGQSTAVVTEPVRCPRPEFPAQDSGNDYLRYRLTESGVSTLAAPGDADQRFTADGLEHNERGTPSARDDDHQKQLAKRAGKLNNHPFGDAWARIDGTGELALLCFGSAWAAVTEAATILADAGLSTRTVALRLVAPLQHERLAAALAGCRRVVVVEQNHGAQLFHYLRGQMEFAVPVASYSRAGPVPLNGRAIADYMTAEGR
ncbi:2-oxoacid:acceptor oxidoreductase subunit alpha [Seongchinamella unica]|uniref:2-oxoacid:acceptor oxidoreductase subunit alpha n=1 Tax=Seongchinamella unica TaxID=2547392 RepID=A0A4R5LVC9_9GAMM|nr:2-oxoacid:acceptor oxidoreductase subunit alpha [Seongchinamella unica]TDG15383.1 2-oxoacid:acceptor oxidoreductase subunit alpha [Seongchinamella unica]